jgi:hypothetical protein
MIETIRLGHMLREAVAAPYRHLVTRPTGVAVRGRIEATLDNSGCACAHLDFSDIDLLDFSCADEIVAKLLMAGRETQFVLRGLREDQHEAVDHVLTHHRLAAAAVPTTDEPPRLLGWATADSHAAFDCVRECGPLSAEALATQFGWTNTRAEEALQYLTQHRVVRCHDAVYYPLPFA